MQAVDNNTEKIRIHRVGTFTAGIILVAAGILFILHMFIPVISYTLIFQLKIIFYLSQKKVYYFFVFVINIYFLLLKKKLYLMIFLLY